MGGDLVKIEDAGGFAFEIAVHVFDPAFPVFAIGFVLLLFLLVVEEEELPFGGHTELAQDALFLFVEYPDHFIRFFPSPFDEGRFGLGTGIFTAFLQVGQQLFNIRGD